MVIEHFPQNIIVFQEAVGDTLEELWISYNLIEKLKGLHVMKKLKILYMSNNLVKDWGKAMSSFLLWNTLIILLVIFNNLCSDARIFTIPLLHDNHIFILKVIIHR